LAISFFITLHAPQTYIYQPAAAVSRLLSPMTTLPVPAKAAHGKALCHFLIFLSLRLAVSADKTAAASAVATA
jgi:hypothetical protein